MSVGMENTYTSFEPQTQWQFNNADQGADHSIYVRSQVYQTTGGLGVYVCRIYLLLCQILSNAGTKRCRHCLGHT